MRSGGGGRFGIIRLMNIDSLLAVRPIDGRYSNKCSELQEIFSEFGLIKRRVLVECTWLEALCDDKRIKECKALSAKERVALRKIAAEFSLKDAQRIKDIEKTTNHDVKAVEYFLKEKLVSCAPRIAPPSELASLGGYSLTSGKDSASPFSVTTPSEKKLALQLLEFPGAVVRASEIYKPSVLADYLFQTAQLYSSFYQNSPILKSEESVKNARLRLCALFGEVLKTGLHLLGIETPSHI